jgi:hypothetical protein
MSNSSYLKFKEISIISLKNQKAFKTELDDGINVILGGNGAGKSSLIKSLYGAFGIDIRISRRWRNINPVTILKFKVKDENYKIVRSGKTVGLFDSKDELLDLFENEPIRIAEYFKDIFDYQIELPSYDYELITPPLNYLFLPYYVDQEDGWTKSWNSMKKGTVRNGRQEIIPYHAGIKTNREFVLQAEIKILKGQIIELNKEIKVVKSIINRTELELKTISLNSSTEDFEIEIDELLKSTNKLNNKRQVYIDKLTRLQADKINLSDQIKITENALGEIKKDYHFALNVEDESIECPTCGTLHENSFVQRFDLIQDESNLLGTLSELYDDLKLVDVNIKKTRNGLDDNKSELNDIDNILLERKNEIRLKDVIENEGKKSMQLKLRDEVSQMEIKLGDLSISHNRKSETLKGLRNSDRIKEIKNFYQDLMKGFLVKLKVNDANSKDYGDLNSTIVSNEIGNTVPRMLLAYFYTFFHLMKKYSSTVYFPIVIDSPNQQAPDRENLINIIEFIFQNLPSETQSVIGIEESLGVDIPGKIIQLEKGKGLLNERDYQSVYEESEKLLLKINSNRKTTLL